MVAAPVDSAAISSYISVAFVSWGKVLSVQIDFGCFGCFGFFFFFFHLRSGEREKYLVLSDLV